MRDDLDHLYMSLILKSNICHSFPSPVTSSNVLKLLRNERIMITTQVLSVMWCPPLQVRSNWSNCTDKICAVVFVEGGEGPGRHARWKKENKFKYSGSSDYNKDVSELRVILGIRLVRCSHTPQQKLVMIGRKDCSTEDWVAWELSWVKIFMDIGRSDFLSWRIWGQIYSCLKI